MKRSSLSLKWLEVFQLAARSGSIRDVAEETGLSVSTVSHHIRALEMALGVSLLDHRRRPMVVTPAGALFVRSVDEALQLLRKAEVEVRSGTLPETRALALALIEDFDSEIAPELARILTGAMPNCEFRHLTRPSHEILGLLHNREIDIGIATRPQSDPPDLIEHPLLRDPYVLAVPAAQQIAPEDYLTGRCPLPLLRYAKSQIMGAQIEAQLRRLRIDLPRQFEFESNQSIMGLIAEGGGWAITTPLNYMRAHRFHRQISLIAFPGKGFARYISVFTGDVHSAAVTSTVTGTLRRLIQNRAVDPAVERMPWLQGAFALSEEHQTAKAFRL
ncbi:LysR family transcriptional regulator [Roseovarius sp. ZX-A-9]|uniref:LysR substrate-binding domain-containing protein n=1 Tax=Roseovarius sp. ZX-A-9 TaxID=3014783 RepID=UPI0023308CBB|nr:LysR family transcriptional regulator [Roseovarius sp. ZX-A-9]MDX1785446.1 LysR family transcriptional regulator [Roseovarius sp.]